MHYSATFKDFWYCGYDDKGNLYLSSGISGGYALASINTGSDGSIDAVALSVNLYGATYFEPSVQWDGAEMTVSSTVSQQDGGKYTGPVKIYRLSIASGKASVIGTTTLKAPQERQRYESWIQGNAVIGITYYHGRPRVSLWGFPKGGKPSQQKSLHYSAGSGLFEGLTVSLAPSS